MICRQSNACYKLLVITNHRILLCKCIHLTDNGETHMENGRNNTLTSITQHQIVVYYCCNLCSYDVIGCVGDDFKEKNK